MSKQIQLRRGTTAEHATFTGAVGEVTIDTTKDTVVVHDGSTTGGFPLARASDITSFISLSDLSAGTGITYSAGVIAADTDTMATKSYVTTSINDAVALKDNTDEITEGATNLYFTTSRARSSVSVTDSGGDGSLSYNSGNGVITYVGPGVSDYRAAFSAGSGITITDGAISADTATMATKSYVDSSITTAIATKDNSDEITEGSTNLYFTNARARSAVSLTDNGGDGSLSYNPTTGVLSYTGPSATEVRAHFSAGTGIAISDGSIAVDTSTIATKTYVDSAILTKDNTDEISEGVTNLYYTDARARGAISLADVGGDGSLSYNSSTGTLTYIGPSASEVRAHFTAGSGITISSGSIAADTTVVATKTYVDDTIATAVAAKDNTDEITEGTSNLYFTSDRARASLTATTGSGSYNAITGVITIPTNTSELTNGAGFITASDSITGSAAKWTTARTITLAGDLSGSVSIDGSANATLTATVAANSVALGTDTTGNYVAGVTAGSYITTSGVAGEGWSPTIAVDATSANTASKVVARDATGNFSANIITADLTGTADFAKRLKDNITISLTGDVTGSVITNLSSNPTITTTIAANSVALGTDTTGNYVAGLTAGTGVTVSGTAGEGWSPTVAIGQAVGTTDNVTFNNLTLNGNLTVNGTTTTVSTTNMEVSDPLIYIGTGNSGNSVDIGIVGNFNDGTYQHTGIVRRAATDKWHLFSGMTTEPGTTITVTDGTYVVDTLVANIEGNVTGNLTGSVTGNASTATTAAAWTTARTITLDGDLSGSVSINGSANATLTATIAANSVALGTDTTGNYVASITNGSYITGADGGSESAGLTLGVDATSANTASKVVARDASGNFSAGTITAALNGNASTATTLQTSRTLSLSGDASGSVSFNGSANADIAVTVADNSHAHTISNVTGLQTALDGKQKNSASVSANSGTAYALNVETYDTFVITMTGNCTFSIAGVPNTGFTTFTLVTKQDATGGRTITWPAAFKFNGGIAPPQTTTANAVDVWSIFTYDGGTTYVVSLAVKDAK